MAKLSARGRKTVVEAVRQYSVDTLQRAHDKFQASYKPDYIAGSDLSLTIWERSTRRLMSDGSILEKRDVRFRPTPNCAWEDPQGRLYSYGWKLRGKLKAGLTAQDFARIYSQPRKDGSPSSWAVSTDAKPAPKIISQRRIMAAIESGESLGFCTACGSDQYGVEPDANGYKCESCGEMAVSGAEQLLLEIA
jgi:hypothetical protein